MNIVNNITNIKDFEAFFNAHYVAMQRYCNTMVKDIADAEDIVQQVFLSVWKRRKDINMHTSSKAYLYKMVHNASLDFLKHQKVKLNYEKESNLNFTEAIVSDSLVNKEMEMRILQAIKALPLQCGKIFQMSRITNLKYREIAVELNLSEKTVENQMGIALKLLRESLKDYLVVLVTLIYFLK